MAEDTIRAYFETRLALLEPVFPLACHRLCEGPDFSLEFNYKPPQHPLVEGKNQYCLIKQANMQAAYGVIEFMLFDEHSLVSVTVVQLSTTLDWYLYIAALWPCQPL